jgi:hypothetical protein
VKPEIGSSVASTTMSNISAKVSNEATQRGEAMDFGNLNIKAKSFTPSYKKYSSCSEPSESYQSLEMSSGPKKIEEIDIENLSFINIGY